MRALALVGRIALIAVGVAALIVAGRGLLPVLPGLRFLLHPLAIALLAAIVLLVRLGRPGPRKSGSPGGGPT